MELPWRVLEEIEPDDFAAVRRQAIFECCKWDPQVEDVATLAAFPLVLKHDVWLSLAGWAECLAQEAVWMEEALLEKPELHRELGMSRAICKTLRRLSSSAQSNPSPRVMRFDFHFTSEGWRISEGNTDVPGGFNEASGFTRLLAQHYRGTETCGDPASALAHAILRRVGEGAMIAMVHATGFTDDRQVMAFLGLHFEGCGLRSVLASPDHLRWRERRVFMESQWHSGPVDLAVRFFPAEWLPDLPSRCGWHHLFGNSETPLCNPATALLTQSKRLPLVWDGLDVRLPAWRRLLPETRDIRDIQVDNRRDWVWKPALGRVGDSIGLSGVTSEKDLTWIRHNALRHPRAWIAQRRFEIVPIETADGLLFPCFGVYTIDGRAAGVYGRIGRNRLIDYRAQDIVVLKDLADPINCKPRPQPSFELGASPRAEPYWNTAFRLHHLQTTH